MIPTEFEHVRATSVDDAVRLLGEHGDEAKLLSGGQSLIPLLKLRFARPSVLVDLGEIAELRGIAVDGDVLRIGASTRIRDVERSSAVRDGWSLLATTAASVADRQVRSRGTVGGSLSHADAAGDLPCALLALGASVVAQGPSGRRTVPVDELFTDFWQTCLAPDEVLVEVHVPRPSGPGAYQKFSARSQDWATVAVAVSGGRVALASMGPTTVRALATEAALAGGASPAEAARVADEGTHPMTDLRATDEYRRHLACLLTERALLEVAALSG